MPQTPFLHAKGLHTFANDLSEIPEGSLLEATNVVIDRDGIIEPRRGFKLYGGAMGASPSIHAKQLLTYKERVLRHFSSTLEFDSDGAGTFSAFAGSVTEPTAGTRIKGVEQNGNFYFTTSAGIKKLSAASASDLVNAQIVNAGGIKALDLQVSLNKQIGFLAQESIVGYRVVWGIKDNNTNLILGTPSSRTTISNPLTPLLATDYNALLAAMDAIPTLNSVSNPGGYVSGFKVSPSVSSQALATSIIGLTTKLDADLGYFSNVASPGGGITVSNVSITSSVAHIVFSANVSSSGALGTGGLAAGNMVSISGFSGTLANLNGKFLITAVVNDGAGTNNAIEFSVPGAATVTSTATTNGTVKRIKYAFFTQPTVGITPSTATLLSLQAYYDSIVGALQAEVNAIIPSTSQPVGNFSTQSATTNLTFSVPAGITTNHFYQIYRTALTTSSGVNQLSLFDPGDECGLIFEANPSVSDIATGSITIQDITPDSFRGANLYTNPNSGEGIAQANEVPPLSFDIAYFKGSTFYANTQTKHRKTINLLGLPKFSPILSGLTNVSVTSNVCTLTFSSSVAASLAVSNRIFFSGAKGASSVLNGEQVISAVSGNTATFNLTTTNFTDSTTSNFGTLYRISSLTISDGTTTHTYTFYPQIAEKFTVTTSAGTTTLRGHYFQLNSAKDAAKYYVWYSVDAVGVDPAVTGRTGIKVSILSTDTSTQVATKTAAAINTVSDFTASPSVNVVTITNNNPGICSAPADVSTGFTVAVTQVGTGEDLANLRVPISVLPTPSQEVDETARALVKSINFQASELVAAFYLSGPSDVPGIISLEAKNLGQKAFFLLSDRAETGIEFNPDITPLTVTSISVSSNGISTLTCSNHGLARGALVYIQDTNCTPSINGAYTVVSVPSSSTFTITATVTGPGTFARLSNEKSDNEVAPNRLYYSKYQQPEAVPLLNYLDVGAKDQPILRIIALRDSLFILKSNAVYRLTGETSANFVVTLFDNSTFILSADSAAVLNNQIYMYSSQGVSSISDTGISVISRPIENLLTQLTGYAGFQAATFATGYEKDRAYLLFTVKNPSDSIATQCFRYNTFTQTWTIFDLSKTCAVVNNATDRLYLGAGDTNFIEVERKSFTRLDYADREVGVAIPTNSVFGQNVFITPVTNSGISAGDSLVQVQYLTLGQFNHLLIKLDADSGTQNKDYYSSLVSVPGDELRAKLSTLAAKLDADPRNFNTGSATRDYAASIASYGTAFVDEQNVFNLITSKLNNDPGISDINYMSSTGTTTFEMRINAISQAQSQITLDAGIPFIVGPATIYNRISSNITWCPHFFQDPSILKHVREATVIFRNSNFSTAQVAYASDLMPSFVPVPFAGTGNGIFGESVFGNDYFGGDGSGAPLRTYIPRDKQRCRYINTRFSFSNAFETYAIQGLSYTFELLSSRGYR